MSGCRGHLDQKSSAMASGNSRQQKPPRGAGLCAAQNPAVPDVALRFAPAQRQEGRGANVRSLSASQKPRLARFLREALGLQRQPTQDNVDLRRPAQAHEPCPVYRSAAHPIGTNRNRLSNPPYQVVVKSQRVGKLKVTSQHITSMAAEPMSAYKSPPHWYSRPDMSVPKKRPSALAA